MFPPKPALIPIERTGESGFPLDRRSPLVVESRPKDDAPGKHLEAEYLGDRPRMPQSSFELFHRSEQFQMRFAGALYGSRGNRAIEGDEPRTVV